MLTTFMLFKPSRQANSIALCSSSSPCGQKVTMMKLPVQETKSPRVHLHVENMGNSIQELSTPVLQPERNNYAEQCCSEMLAGKTPFHCPRETCCVPSKSRQRSGLCSPKATHQTAIDPLGNFSHLHITDSYPCRRRKDPWEKVKRRRQAADPNCVRPPSCPEPRRAECRT